MVTNQPANAGDTDSIPRSGRCPGEGNGNPLQYSCLENSMDRGALVNYSPRGCKEPGMTERLSTHALLRSNGYLWLGWNHFVVVFSFLLRHKNIQKCTYLISLYWWIWNNAYIHDANTTIKATNTFITSKIMVSLDSCSFTYLFFVVRHVTWDLLSDIFIYLFIFPLTFLNAWYSIVNCRDYVAQHFCRVYSSL